jgi:hypothetical protein
LAGDDTSYKRVKVTKLTILITLIAGLLFLPQTFWAQDPPEVEETPTVEGQPEAPEQVNVQPRAQDNEQQPQELSPEEQLNEETYANQQPVSSPESVSNVAEGNLRNGDEEIQEQAQQSRSPEEGKNLLDE